MDLERPNWLDRAAERSHPIVGGGVARHVQPVGVSSDGLLGLVLAADDDLLVELRHLRVSGRRGDGHATRVLTRHCAEADARGLVLTCTLTDESGADRTRLEASCRRAPVDPGLRLSEHTWQRPRSTKAYSI
ncbi:hypothetical protein ACF1G5_37280 [Streptomyces coeruleorubidus]|uniref:hypothetical protein n=1 Tax=Streptomyces coeruleorubidus TaxID=116188 RepID=UPI0037019016